MRERERGNNATVVDRRCFPLYLSICLSICLSLSLLLFSERLSAPSLRGQGDRDRRPAGWRNGKICRRALHRRARGFYAT